MTWQALTNQPTFGIAHLILMTDGTVMAPDVGGGYHRLTPDANGDYAQGIWSDLTSPSGFGFDTQSFGPVAAVLATGDVVFFGFDLPAQSQDIVGIYDSSLDAWSYTPGQGSPLSELADGRVLCGGKVTAVFDPYALSWSETSTNSAVGYTTPCSVLLPDGSVLWMSGNSPPSLAKYVEGSGWTSLPSPTVIFTPECAVLLPSGFVFCVDNSHQSALYDPSKGVWTAGPPGPGRLSGDDPPDPLIPACLESTGKVLLVMTAETDTGFASKLFEYDGVTISPVPDPTIPQLTNSAMMLPLPSGQGQILVVGATSVFVFTPDGVPDPAWAPQNVVVPPFINPGSVIQIDGAQLNGLSQAAYNQGSSPTNYPLVRIRNLKSGHVFYCPTSDHSLAGTPSMGVATGAATVSTQVAVPSTVETGDSHLCVIANGIETCFHVDIQPKFVEQKPLFSELKLIFENEKAIVEQVIKGSEGDPGDRGPEVSQEWIRVVQLLAERTDRLQAEVNQLKSFIRASERPVVGQAPPSPSKATPGEGED